MSDQSLWSCHATLSTLLDIISIISRIDVKNEVIKELERVSAMLDNLSNIPNVDQNRLSHILTTLNGLRRQLGGLSGPVGQDLRDNELLKTLLQKNGVPGGLCDFDLPLYRQWLQRPAEQRTADLRGWLSSLDCLRHSVELILKMVRESAEAIEQHAEGGIFQRQLDGNTAYQLIRVTVPASCPYYAEISAGKHRVTVRFMGRASHNERPRQATEPVRFQLACCVL
jgi:cell division protein ZapD